jgi:hypothetical protein
VVALLGRLGRLGPRGALVQRGVPLVIFTADKAIEISAGKQIAGLRLKRAGARWTETGARETAKARAAWLSDQWDELAARRADLPLVA